MGKNYTSDSYKKSYKKDYVKTYRYGHDLLFSGEKSGAVDAEGPASRTSPIRKETRLKSVNVSKPKPVVREEPKIEVVEAEPVIELIPDNEPVIKPYAEIKVTEVKEELPPPFDFLKEEIKKRVDIDSFDYPVEHLYDDTYLNVYNQKEISEEEARELLYKTGFAPKKEIGILPIIFLSIVSVVLFGFFGVAIVFIAGVFLYKKESITFEKIVNFRKLRFSMPATPKELVMHKIQGVVCFIIAVVGSIIKFVSY